MKTILACVDFKDVSNMVVRQLRSLQEKYDSEAHLLFVKEVVDFPLLSAQMMLLDTATNEVASKADLIAMYEDKLKKLAESHGLTKTTIKVIIGNPEEKILDYQDEIEADVTLLGVEKHNAIEKFFLGSVAEKIAHRTLRDLILVKNHSNVGFNKVICATEFFASEDYLLERAAEFSSKVGGKLTALNVVSNMHPEIQKLLDSDELTKMSDLLEKQVVAEIAKANELKKENVEYIVDIARERTVAQAIVTKVKQLQADLLFLRPHSRSALSKFFIGSVSDTVLNAVPSSIYLARK